MLPCSRRFRKRGLEIMTEAGRRLSEQPLDLFTEEAANGVAAAGEGGYTVAWVN
jgi:hypothetical protein